MSSAFGAEGAKPKSSKKPGTWPACVWSSISLIALPARYLLILIFWFEFRFHMLRHATLR